jgi:hypothetical protein
MARAFLVFLLVDFTASALAIGLKRCSADRRNNLRLLAQFGMDGGKPGAEGAALGVTNRKAYSLLWAIER